MTKKNIKSSITLRYLLLLVIGFLGLSECDTCGRGTGGLGPRPGSIELIDICMKIRKPTDEDVSVYASRVHNIAEKTVEKLAEGNKSWEFIGLTEAYYEKRDPAGDYPYHRRSPIPCTELSQTVLTAICFDASLRNTSQPPDLNDQYGDVAFIANHEHLSIEGSVRKKKLEGFDIVGLGALAGIGEAAEYKVIGARFRILDQDGNPTEYTVPLYVVHLPTAVSSHENRMSQLNSMIEAIKDWWQDRDKGNSVLTPIVIGDFNFGHTGGDDPDLGKTLRADFVEAGMVLGGNVIEGIWVGQEKNFPNSKGTMVFEEYVQWDEFNDGAQLYTDHRAVYAKLYPLTWAFKETYKTSPTRARSNDGPALLASRDLYLAWSGRGSEKRIFIMMSGGGDPSDFTPKSKVYRPDRSDPISSEYSPGLARFQGKYYIAWVAAGEHLHIMSKDGLLIHEQSWSNHRRFAYQTDKAPALLATNDYLFIAWKEKGGEKIYFIKSTDGWNWSSRSFIGVRTDGAPTMAYYQNKLFIAWIGTDERYLWVMSSHDNGQTWSNKVKILNARSDAGPALLAVHKEERVLQRLRREPQDRLYLMWRGKNNMKLQIMSSPDGMDWSHAKRVIDDTSDYKPALAYFDDRFVIAWTGRDDEKHINLKGSHIGGEISIDVNR